MFMATDSQVRACIPWGQGCLSCPSPRVQSIAWEWVLHKFLNEWANLSTLKHLWNVCTSCKTYVSPPALVSAKELYWVSCLQYGCPQGQAWMSGTPLRSPPTQREGTHVFFCMGNHHGREGAPRFGCPLEEWGYFAPSSHRCCERVPTAVSSRAECWLRTGRGTAGVVNWSVLGESQHFWLLRDIATKTAHVKY